MAIVIISRQIGSLGDEIAKAVSDRLGYKYIEKTKISHVISEKGFSLFDFDKFDEKKPSIWQSISLHKIKFSHLIKSAIYELIAKDNVVILGRGGQAILRDFPKALRVRIIASHPTRLSRIKDEMGCTEEKANQIIIQSDRDRFGYVRALFNEDWDDISLYDLVINTNTMSLETAVKMIAFAVEANEFNNSPEVLEKCRELSLTQKAVADHLDIPDLES
ncbi:MAG: cytidylate kinase-like family protein, partial [Proteobacteria bacterium]|nr:cytidylate kinase-like family protein [Pseudomonadota bacterium]